MNPLAYDLEHAFQECRKSGHSTQAVEHLIDIATRVSDIMTVEEIVAEIHSASGLYPYINDRDVGAIVLEYIADESSSPAAKAILYRHAAFRAKWCAQGASSGGEGIARSQQLNRIIEKQKLA